MSTFIQPPSGRLAIRCLRPDMTGDRDRDEREMSRTGAQLGYAVDKTTVILNPLREGPWTTIMLALRGAHADAVIVPDLGHVDGIDHWIRQHAQLITVVGERVLERTQIVGVIESRTA